MFQNTHIKELPKLRRLLIEHFSLNELKNLAFDLGINEEEFGELHNQYVRELIRYCQRHDLLDCLILAILKERVINNDSIAKELSNILLGFGGCLKQVKVVIVVAEDLHERLSEFLDTFAKALNIPPEKIKIECAVSGSSRLLLSLPSEIADRLSDSHQHLQKVLPYTIDLVIHFRELDEVTQTAWRLAVSQVHPSVAEPPTKILFMDPQSWQDLLYQAQQTAMAARQDEEKKTPKNEPLQTTLQQVSHLNTAPTNTVIQQTRAAPSTYPPAPNQTESKNDSGGAFALRGFAFGFLNTAILILLMGDGDYTIPKFISDAFLAHLYEWIAIAFGVTSSVLIYWLRDNDTDWSLWFAGGYGLGVPAAVMLLQPENNRSFVTWAGDFFGVFLLSWLTNALLKSLRQSLTR